MGFFLFLILVFLILSIVCKLKKKYKVIQTKEKYDDFWDNIYLLKQEEINNKYIGEKKKTKSKLYKEAEEIVNKKKKQEDLSNIRYSIKKPSKEEICLMKETFKDYLLKLIDERNLKDSDVYNKAMISRQVFNNIINKEGYIPTKITLFKLILSLKLVLNEAVEFLNKAGYSFVDWDIDDMYVKLCIENKYYEVDEIIKEIYSFK